jgi:hypothetical protein
MKTGKGTQMTQTFSIAGYNRPDNYHPVFLVSPNIVIPDHFVANGLFKNDFPVHVAIELKGSVDQFDFDVMLVCDEKI